jgi:hypothetical protein
MLRQISKRSIILNLLVNFNRKAHKETRKVRKVINLIFK